MAYGDRKAQEFPRAFRNLIKKVKKLEGPDWTFFFTTVVSQAEYGQNFRQLQHVPCYGRCLERISRNHCFLYHN